MVSTLHHIALVTRDVAAAEAFYGDVLGLLRIRRQEDARGLRAVWLSLGPDAFLALERADLTGPTRDDAAPGLHCLALGIRAPERREIQRRLAEAGYPTEKETAYTFYVRDPDGVLVGLSHFPGT